MDFADPMDIKWQDDAMLGIKVAALHMPWEVTERWSESNEVVYVLLVSDCSDLMFEEFWDLTMKFQICLERH